jgi:SAM-dependent methyltransferase
MREYQKETIETYIHHAEQFRDTRKKFLYLDPIKKFVSLLPEKTVLDVGCGPGKDAVEFVEFGCSVTGIDLVPAFVRMSQESVPLATFYQMDILDLQFEDGSFGGVWANAVLLHLMRDDAMSALKEIYRVLRPGGVVYITVKKGAGHSTEWDKRLNDARRLFVFYEQKEMEKLLQDVGFVVLTVESLTQNNTIKDVEWLTIFAQKSL